MGYNNKVIFESDGDVRRTVTLVPSVQSVSVFNWDTYEFDNIKLTQADGSSINSVFSYQCDYITNNKVTFNNSEITGLNVTDCISVFATNNLYNTTVKDNFAQCTLFAIRDNSTIKNSTITNNSTGKGDLQYGAIQVTANKTATIINSTIKDNTCTYGDLQIDAGSTAVLSGNTVIGEIYKAGSLVLNSDFTGSAGLTIPGEKTVGTVLATVQDRADVSGITVNGLADNLMLKVEGGQLVIAEKPASSVTPNADVEKVTVDTTDSDMDAVGFVGNVKVTGTANIGTIGFKVTAKNNDQKTATQDWVYDTVITSADGGSTDVVFGLMLTDLRAIGLTRENVSAEYLN